MKYVLAENYLCFLTLLEMIIDDSTSYKITQHDIAEGFGIVVPQGYKININNVNFSSEENDYGVRISEKKLQDFFNMKGIRLNVKYLDGTRINEFDFDTRLARYLKENKYVIFAYSYGVLYNKRNHGSLGHVALLEKVCGENIIQIYDPGPDEVGIKEINILKMYDAMKKKVDYI